MAAQLALVALALTSSGCFVSDNPDVQAPPLRGPFLSSLIPSSFRVIEVSDSPSSQYSRQNTTVSFQLWSDDGGNTPLLFVQRDFDVSPPETGTTRRNKSLILAQPIPPGDFDHPRIITASFPMTNDVSAGCHSVTAIVAYDFELDQWVPRPGSRWESVTWWLDVGAVGAGGGNNIISTCPEIGGPLDAGAEGSADGEEGGP
jgi:hypothetical protein